MAIALGLDVAPLNQDEVLIQFGTRSTPNELLRDPDRRGVLGYAFTKLREHPRRISELHDFLDITSNPDLKLLLDELLTRGILSDPETEPVRQFFKYAHLGGSGLAEKSAAIIGCGPLGSKVAVSLSQHGIGHLVLMDERIANDNWWQFQPFVKKPGEQEFASHCLGNFLSRRGQKVESHSSNLNVEGLERVITEVDFVIVAFEQLNPFIYHIVNRVALRAQKPWMQTFIDGMFGVIGPIYIPFDTACFNCYQTLADSVNKRATMPRALFGMSVKGDSTSFFPGLPCFADIVAGYSVLAVVHFLNGKGSFANGRAIQIDFSSFAIDIDDVLRLPRCPACGPQYNNFRPPFSPEIVST